MNSDYFVCAGESLIDLIQAEDGRFTACLGGAVFNFALALARQNVPTAYANPLSVDTFGQRFRDKLNVEGVALLSDMPVAQPSSLAVVTLNPQGQPSYIFHRSEVADRAFDASALQIPLSSGRVKALHVGGLALVPADIDRYLALISSVASQAGVISVDANMRPSVEPRLALYRDAVHRALFKAHIIKVSDEDLLHLGRVSWRADEQDLVMASKALFDDCPQAQLVALTLGAKGAYLITRQKTWRAWPRTDLIIADTVGAGDCFIAALNASLWQAGYLSGDRLVASNDVLINALKHAIAGASIDVTRVGCNPGNWQEVSSCAENITIDAT